RRKSLPWQMAYPDSQRPEGGPRLPCPPLAIWKLMIGFGKPNGGAMPAAVPWRGGPGVDAASIAPRPGSAGAGRSLLRSALLAACVALGLGAAAPPPPAPEQAPAIALAYRVEHLKAAFHSGNPNAVQSAVQEVELLRRT